MSENIVDIQDSTFEAEVIEASHSIPVLVDCWAEWCGPCKMIAPSLTALATDKADAVKVVKLNVDHNSEVPAKFGVRGIPTLMLFKNGIVVATKIGAMPKGQLYSFVEEYL